MFLGNRALRRRARPPNFEIHALVFLSHFSSMCDTAVERSSWWTVAKWRCLAGPIRSWIFEFLVLLLRLLLLLLLLLHLHQNLRPSYCMRWDVFLHAWTALSLMRKSSHGIVECCSSVASLVWRHQRHREVSGVIFSKALFEWPSHRMWHRRQMAANDACACTSR